MKKINFSDLIREEFQKYQIRTLHQLYEIVLNVPDIDIDEKDIKHRIRSSVNSLVNSKEIVRIKPSTYKKI